MLIPEKRLKISKATVDVTMRHSMEHSHGYYYSGKITTRIGEMPVMNEEISIISAESVHRQPTYVVAVPCGSVLSIEVDWQIESTSSNSQRVKHLQVLKFVKGTPGRSDKICGHEVEVKITWGEEEEIDEGTELEFIIARPGRQPYRPIVEVKIALKL